MVGLAFLVSALLSRSAQVSDFTPPPPPPSFPLPPSHRRTVPVFHRPTVPAFHRPTVPVFQRPRSAQAVSVGFAVFMLGFLAYFVAPLPLPPVLTGHVWSLLPY